MASGWQSCYQSAKVKRYQWGFKTGVLLDIQTSTSFKPLELTVIMSPAFMPLVIAAKLQVFDGYNAPPFNASGTKNALLLLLLLIRR
jgi:hypothetical protein